MKVKVVVAVEVVVFLQMCKLKPKSMQQSNKKYQDRLTPESEIVGGFFLDLPMYTSLKLLILATFYKYKSN